MVILRFRCQDCLRSAMRLLPPAELSYTRDSLRASQRHAAGSEAAGCPLPRPPISRAAEETGPGLRRARAFVFVLIVDDESDSTPAGGSRGGREIRRHLATSAPRLVCVGRRGKPYSARLGRRAFVKVGRRSRNATLRKGQGALRWFLGLDQRCPLRHDEIGVRIVGPGEPTVDTAKDRLRYG